MTTKTSINFFDLNFWFGENYLSQKYSLSEKKTLEILSKRKKQKNITFTLISNFLSLFYDAEIGNKLTAKLINQTEFMQAGASGILFMEQNYFFNPGEFGKWLKRSYEKGFKLLKISPKTHKYPFELSLFSYFYEIMDSCNFPLMISIDEIDITGNKNIEWDKIAKIANLYDNMPVIIDGGQSKELMYNCYLLSLLNNTSNVYFETHNLLGYNQIEDLADFKGADRLVFGSCYPFFDDSLAVSRIVNSGLDEKGKNKIALLNLKKIIDNIII
ncbi:MAG: hypothetical protein PHR39_03650 [Actinomycetota bacterium]|nr:hypothetical protein [Actinomycetota bacterium]